VQSTQADGDFKKVALLMKEGVHLTKEGPLLLAGDHKN